MPSEKEPTKKLSWSLVLVLTAW